MRVGGSRNETGYEATSKLHKPTDLALSGQRDGLLEELLLTLS